MDGTGSGSCPVAGFGISGVEPSGPATRTSHLLLKTTDTFPVCIPSILLR